VAEHLSERSKSRILLQNQSHHFTALWTGVCAQQRRRKNKISEYKCLHQEHRVEIVLTTITNAPVLLPFYSPSLTLWTTLPSIPPGSHLPSFSHQPHLPLVINISRHTYKLAPRPHCLVLFLGKDSYLHPLSSFLFSLFVSSVCSPVWVNRLTVYTVIKKMWYI